MVYYMISDLCIIGCFRLGFTLWVLSCFVVWLIVALCLVYLWVWVVVYGYIIAAKLLCCLRGFGGLFRLLFVFVVFCLAGVFCGVYCLFRVGFVV